MLKTPCGAVDVLDVRAIARRISSRVSSGPRLPGPDDLERFLGHELREPSRGNVAFMMVAIEDSYRSLSDNRLRWSLRDGVHTMEMPTRLATAEDEF